jgi:hypothetical protein
MGINRRTRVRAALTASVVALGMVQGVAPAQAATCASGYICLFDGTNFTGRKLSYRDCARVDIGKVWGNDRIRSIMNNQSSGTLSHFYSWHAAAANWTYVGYSRAKANHATVSAGVASAEAVDVC